MKHILNKYSEEIFVVKTKQVWSNVCIYEKTDMKQLLHKYSGEIFVVITKQVWSKDQLDICGIFLTNIALIILKN